jgi:hypothetical protein
MYILLGICGIELFVLDRHSHGRHCPSLQFHCFSKGLSDRGEMPCPLIGPCRAVQGCRSVRAEYWLREARPAHGRDRREGDQSLPQDRSTWGLYSQNALGAQAVLSGKSVNRRSARRLGTMRIKA